MFINIWVLYGIFVFMGSCLAVLSHRLHKKMRIRRPTSMAISLVFSPVFTVALGVGVPLKIFAPVKDTFIFWGAALLVLFACSTIAVLIYLKHSIEVK